MLGFYSSYIVKKRKIVEDSEPVDTTLSVTGPVWLPQITKTKSIFFTEEMLLVGVINPSNSQLSIANIKADNQDYLFGANVNLADGGYILYNGWGDVPDGVITINYEIVNAVGGVVNQVAFVRVNLQPEFDYNLELSPMLKGELSRIITAEDLLAGVVDPEGDDLYVSSLALNWGEGVEIKPLDQENNIIDVSLDEHKGPWLLVRENDDEQMYPISAYYKIYDSGSHPADRYFSIDTKPTIVPPVVIGPLVLTNLSYNIEYTITEENIRSLLIIPDGEVITVTGIESYDPSETPQNRFRAVLGTPIGTPIVFYISRNKDNEDWGYVNLILSDSHSNRVKLKVEYTLLNPDEGPQRKEYLAQKVIYYTDVNEWHTVTYEDLTDLLIDPDGAELVVLDRYEIWDGNIAEVEVTDGGFKVRKVNSDDVIARIDFYVMGVKGHVVCVFVSLEPLKIPTWP